MCYVFVWFDVLCDVVVIGSVMVFILGCLNKIMFVGMVIVEIG